MEQQDPQVGFILPRLSPRVASRRPSCANPSDCKRCAGAKMKTASYHIRQVRAAKQSTFNFRTVSTYLDSLRALSFSLTFPKLSHEDGYHAIS